METKVCELCKKEKATKDFYYRLEPNDNHIEQSALPYCKRCTTKILNDYFTKFKDMKKAMFHLCALLDIPFIENVYNKALGNSETVTFTCYYSYLWGSKSDEVNNKYKDFSDSIVIFNDNETDNLSENDRKALEHLIFAWGEQDNLADYKYLENTFKRYTQGDRIENSMQKDLVRDLCLARLEKRKIDENKIDGDSNKVLTKILTLLSKLGLDNFDTSKDETLSDRFITKHINDVEQNEPCELYKEPHKYYDINGVETYNKLFAKRPFGNSLLGNRDFNVDLNTIENYKIEVPYFMNDHDLYGLTKEDYEKMIGKKS